jgi:SAM-dependent methyltransferase
MSGDIFDKDANWWQYANLPSGEPYDWAGASRGESPWDNIDFHLDLGCGTLKKGRLGIDRFWAPGVDLLVDLGNLIPAQGGQKDDALPAMDRTLHRYNATLVERWGDEAAVQEAMALHGLGASAFLPFPDDSIESIISHHALEHIGDGFIPLMDECHRILKPGGVLRIIVPLFPSATAVDDPDHVRYFTERSFEMFCGTPEGDHWAESFSVPYTSCRFEKVDLDMSPPTPPHLQWTGEDAREVRVALRKWGA